MVGAELSSGGASGRPNTLSVGAESVPAGEQASSSSGPAVLARSGKDACAPAVLEPRAERHCRLRCALDPQTLAVQLRGQPIVFVGTTPHVRVMSWRHGREGQLCVLCR